MKTKKAALIFNWTLTLIVIGVLAWTLLQFNSKYGSFEPLGKKQLTLFKIYSKAESSLFYIDQSAKYSLQQAVYDLAQNGGIPDVEGEELPEVLGNEIPNNNCGKYYGYSLWFSLDDNKVQTTCIDEDQTKSNLLYLFNKNLNKYLLNYPHNIPINNYDYEVNGNQEIIGKALSPLEFDILKDETKQAVKESIKTPEGLIDFTGTELCAKGQTCLLKEDAYNLLLKAQETAQKNGVSLEVSSAYRPLQKQIDIWLGRTIEGYAQRYPDEKIRKSYVCYPYGSDLMQRCPHLTGNAVDVRLKGKTDSELLYGIMSGAGWVKYTKEAWHFECCGTDRYARAKAKGVTEIV